MFLCAISLTLYAIDPLLLSKKVHQTTKKNRRATINFNFNNEEFIDIINTIVAERNANIVLPTGQNAIKQKITINAGQVTAKEAWDLLLTLLDIAGYSVVDKKNIYVIVKNNKNIINEPFPIYINTPLDQIPNNNERIRYIYYLKNIKASPDFDNQLNSLFKETIPDDALLRAEPNSNGLIIVAKSSDVQNFLAIVQALDEVGFVEKLERISLRYTQANNVAKIFTEIFKNATTPLTRYNLETFKEPATYFSSNIKVIPEPITNSLIVLGRAQAVERVKDFIFKYIDIELESGKSILHVYELQYLDAKGFAPILRNIVESARSGGTEQSKAGQSQGGIERLFDQIIIQPDNPGEASEEEAMGKYSGGNKLVIAARNDDWKRIKKLIEKLDQPQPQVIIEVLIADLTIEDIRNLGSITRNINDLAFPGSATAQAAMIDQVVLDASTAGKSGSTALDGLTGVDADLNANTVVVAGQTDLSKLTSIPNNLVAGTTVISISDKNGKTWSIIEILQLLRSTKILSHPHIIAINNQESSIQIGEQRLLVDQAAPSTSGITIRKKPIEANTNLFITPRISSANTVNLQVKIDIDQFTDPTNFTSGNRISRDIVTNATVKSGDILALGGLVDEQATDAIVRTPILSDIPVLGWFFKTRNRDIATTSLTVFISPTILPAKLRGGVGEYTESYIGVAKNYSRQGHLFDNLRDPITRWFFVNSSEAEVIADDFLEQAEESYMVAKGHPLEFSTEREAKVLDPNLDKSPFTTVDALKFILENEPNPLLFQQEGPDTTDTQKTTADRQEDIQKE